MTIAGRLVNERQFSPPGKGRLMLLGFLSGSSASVFRKGATVAGKGAAVVGKGASVVTELALGTAGRASRGR